MCPELGNVLSLSKGTEILKRQALSLSKGGRELLKDESLSFAEMRPELPYDAP